jgi:phage major head subunit gpT-like protein
MSPAMREWIGGRQAKGFRTNGITIENKKYEGTIDFPVEWIERDKTGQMNIRIAELAQRATGHWGKLLSTLISNGTGSSSGLCYDGQYFFDSDHSEGDSGTQTNLLTNTEVAALDVTSTTAPTAAESLDAILGVIAHMTTILDDQAEPMNADAKEFLIMTAPKLWAYLVKAIFGIPASSNVSNVIKELEKDGFSVRLASNPRLSYTTQFVTFRTDAPASALIRQSEKPITPSLKGAGSEYEHDNDAWQFGIKTRRNVGYGYWQYAAHATFS